MKLHNLSVIFVIIAIPLILITSYYISLQIDTINMQTAYNAKLLDSTKEAIDAFEINTVEWNANYSETADSKRRDIMASINTFTSSFANNIGIGGASKEYIMAYMPAIAYTLYDGYYIYSPANTKIAITDDNDVGVVMTSETAKLTTGYTYKETDEGKLLYKAAGDDFDGKYNGVAFTLDQSKADTENKHILKPFASYSEKIGDWVINYTLDNYITIYGNIENSETGKEEFVSKSGYLSIIDSDQGVNNISKDNVNDVKYKGTVLKPEYLSEKIAYKDNENVNNARDAQVEEGIFRYVYESDKNTKVYFDENGKAFIVGSDLVRENLSEYMDRYKKVTIPQYKSGKWTYKEIYQSLYNGKWYDKDKKNVISEEAPGYGIVADKQLDYSAINYCVESYIVTKFVNSLKLEPSKVDETCICGYIHSDTPFVISSNNNPENKDSAFSIHKRGIIKNAIESNLNQAITSYSRNSEGEYKLPKLTETDWDQILRNVSIITFIQNIPIGMKYYNNYAIATSTMNKEYVDPEEIYLNAAGDEYYHMPYCKHLEETSNMIGYRSIDYVQRTYTQTGTEKPTYYYKHAKKASETANQSSNINVNQACYYCLIQKSLYEKDTNNERLSRKETAYNTALARERYVARMAKLPPEVEASYYINVTPYTIKDGEEIDATGAKYSINGDTHEGKTGVKIDKNVKTPKVYKIVPTFGEQNTLGTNLITNDLGSFDAEKETSTEEGNTYSVYKPDSYADVTINEYNPTIGVNFSVSASEWTAGYSADTTEKMTSFSPETDGYINIKLKYEKNYEVGNENSGISAFANIDNSNELTIVTNTGDITGYVRLRFTNRDNTYYSKDIFNIENVNSNIYCKIRNNYNWYENDWKVDVLSVDGKTVIKSTDRMEYYTLRDATGLKGFSNAVNGTKGPAGGATTLGRTFKVIDNITSVGELAPIAGVNNLGDDGWNKIWFEGVFEGENHIISGIKINYENDKSYNAFGLFGWVGKNAIISNLNVETTIASFAKSTPKNNKDNRICIGGIVGYTDGQINNCTIMSSSNIGAGKIEIDTLYATKKDIYYVGGIAGYADGEINQCKVESGVNVKGGKIISNGKLDKLLQTYTGGVIGYKNTSQEINGSFNVSCTVAGHDNVGGIVGFNAGGDIKNVSFKGSLQGDGENIGGIVGCNTGGTISNCENIVDINVSGKNVGGIVGCNYNSNIIKCYNNKAVTGNKNVGGIVGITYAGWIDYCSNNGKVSGAKNTLIGSKIDIKDFLLFYNIIGENATGTGGIVGKMLNATVSRSYNNNTVECNYNGGGISGLNSGGTIKYCFNGKNGNITNGEDEDDIVVMNRMGGICGAGLGVNVNNSYNIGNVNGKSTSKNTPLGSPTGGIIGFLVDDTSWIGDDKYNVNNKYFEIKITYLKIKSTHNNISYCYNKGNVKGYYTAAVSDSLYYNGAIIGYIGVSINIDTEAEVKQTTLLENYYLNDCADSKGGLNGKKESISEGNVDYKGLNENELKSKLYNFADSKIVPKEDVDSGKLIYNTIAPLETDKGYDGYGVLWWEIEDYVKLNINMFMCVIDEEENTKTYTGIPLFSTNAYKPNVILNDKEVNFDSLPAELVMIKKKLPNDEPVECNSYLNWKLMVKNEKYTVKGSVAFTDESEYFDGNTAKGRNKFIELEKWEQDKTISVVPIMETKFDNLDSKDIEVIWKRGETESKLFTTSPWNVYDRNHNKIGKVKGYFYYKTHNSDVIEKDQKSVKIKMDKGDEAETTKNQTVYIKRTEYYKREGNLIKGYTYRGPYYIEEGTEASEVKGEINVRLEYQKAHANKSACNVYIPIENLVDIIGEDQAKNSKLYSAKLNMEFKAVLKNAILKRNTSHLSATIYLERKQKGSEKWEQIDKTVMNSFTEESEKKTIKNDETEFNADLKKLGIKDYGLAGVNYDDELRVNIDLEYNANTEYANIIIKNVNIDISYGPKL